MMVALAGGGNEDEADEEPAEPAIVDAEGNGEGSSLEMAISTALQAPPVNLSPCAERNHRRKVNRYRGAYRDKRDEGCRFYAQITLPAYRTAGKRQRLALGLHSTAEVRRGRPACSPAPHHPSRPR